MAWVASLAHTVRKGFRTERAFADPWAIARAVLAIAVGAAIGWLRGDVLSLTMMSVGAFICGIGTLLAPMRHRIVNAFWMAVCFSAMTALGVFLQPLRWYFLIVLAVAAFIAGLWRSLGAAPGIRACLVVIGMLITADVSPGVDAGLAMVQWIAAGAGLIVLTQLLPPYGRRYAAQRRKLGDVYLSLAAYARDEEAAPGTAHASTAPFTEARRALGLLPQFARPAAAPLYGLLGEAERVRRTLYAAAGARGVPHAALADVLDAVGRTVARGTPQDPPPEARRRLAEWRGGMADSLLPRIAEAERLAALAVDSRPEPSGAPGEAAAAPERHEEVPSLYAAESPAVGGWRRITAELRPGAPLFRHAIRVGVGTALGEAAGRALGDFWGHGLPAHGFWAALTTMLVLFPDYEHTFARGWSRPIGSIVGGLLAWGLLQFHWSHGALAIGAVVFSALVFALLRTGQHVLNLVLTAWIVFLLHGMGTAQGLVAWGRPADTVLGAVIALVIFLLLPTWHHHRIPPLLARWLRAQERLLPAVLTGYSDVGAADPEELEALRGSSRQAREELEEAVDRLSHEPRRHRARWSAAELRRINAAVFDLTRSTGLLTEHLPRRQDEVVPELAEFATPVRDHLSALARAADGAEPVRHGALREVFDSLSASSGLAWLGDPDSAGGVSRARARALSNLLRTVTTVEAVVDELDGSTTDGPRNG